MKLLMFQMCIILSVSAADIYPQATKFNLQLKDATIMEVFEHIERNSEFIVLCNEKWVDVNRIVNIDIEYGTIGEILDQVFYGTRNKYKIHDRQVVILVKEEQAGTPKIVHEEMIEAEFLQQEKQVTGTITDINGLTLPGVSIIVRGTTHGTISNTDGKFSLMIPAGADILQISYVGMQTQEIAIGEQTVFAIVMEESVTGLDAVVVVGYTTQLRRTLTGSVGTVGSEELGLRPAGNTTELLQGQIVGLVTRQSSGLPGSDGTTLNIRGFGSPLILVDGVQRGFSQIDPGSIESISVLKDAAAAIYGARAGNGVILVTTKRGTETASQINFHSSMSMSQPTFYAHQAGAREWAEMFHEVGRNPNDFSPAHVNYDPETKRLTNLIDGSDYQGYDWTRAIFRSWVPQQQHNLNARGGTDQVKYFVSVGFTDQASNFKSGDYNFNRYNILSNIDAGITDNLSVSLDFAYHSSLLDKANFDLESMFGAVNHAIPTYPYVHEADPSRAAYPGYTQSGYYLTFKEHSGFIENKDNNISGALEVKYSIPQIRGLSASARINYSDNYYWDKNVAKPMELWDYNLLTGMWSSHGIHRQNQMSVFSQRRNTLQPHANLTYNRSFGDHSIRGMIIGETWSFNQTQLRGSRFDLLSYEAPYLDFASDERKDNSEISSERARASVISRVNYNYQAKYLLDFILRADASAEYPPAGRWGYFPSVSVGWIISGESFIQDNFSYINNLKLRASYGILGNDAVASFAHLTGYNITRGMYMFGTTPSPVINSTGLANPYVTWETMTISNIGLDGTLWNGKLGFEIDAFYRLREDILTPPTAQVPNTFGASLPSTNLNSRDNRGIEVALSHRNRVGNFSYNISPMISWNRGKFVKVDEDLRPVTGDMDEETREFNRLWNIRNTSTGHWDDRRWGLVSDGIFLNQEQLDNHPVNQDQVGNQTLKVGDIIYKDLNGDGIIDWRDEKVISKSGLPNIMYSMNMGARYKGINVRMLWQGASDYTINFTGPAASPFTNESIPLKEHYIYRPIIGIDAEGGEYVTNPDTYKLPRVSQSGRTQNNQRASDFWIYDAKYIRLKNLQISYSLPQSILGNAGITQLEIYMNGTNMLTFSNLGIWKDSFDPEIPTHNNRNYPPVKTLSFGVRLVI